MILLQKHAKINYILFRDINVSDTVMDKIKGMVNTIMEYDYY